MGTANVFVVGNLNDNPDFVRPYKWQVQQNLAALQTTALDMATAQILTNSKFCGNPKCVRTMLCSCCSDTLPKCRKLPRTWRLAMSLDSPTASLVAMLILSDHVTGCCSKTLPRYTRLPRTGVTALPRYMGLQCTGKSCLLLQHVLCLTKRITALTDIKLCGSRDCIRPCCSAAAASWAKHAC